MNSTPALKKITSLTSHSKTAARNLWDPLWKLLSFSPADDLLYPARSIVISLEKGSFGIASGSRLFSRIQIHGMKEYEVEEHTYPQPEVIASSLSLYLNETGVTKGEITLGIPKSWALVSTVELPSSVRENLSDVLSYEFDRITPFNAEDAWYDYRIVKETPETLSILLVSAKSDMLRPYIDALSERGIRVTGVTVNLSAYEILSRYMGRNEDTIFIEVKKHGFEGALFSRNLEIRPFSGTFHSEDEQAQAESISTSVSSLLGKVQGQAKTPGIIVLLKDKKTSVKELLQSKLGVPVKMLGEMDIRLKLPLGQEAEVPYAGIGAVLETLWPHAKGMNLLTKGIHEKTKTPRVFTGILLLALIGIWMLYLVAPLRVEEKRLAEIDRQIALRKDEVRAVESLQKETNLLKKEISTINSFKKGKPLSLDIMKELTAILPKSVWLTRVRLTDTTVNLEGFATSTSALLKNLEASGYFQKAEFASPTFRDARMKADRFNIKMEIEGVSSTGDSPEKDSEEADEEE
jgi:Tfp pilus assembly protein PilN